tara:strand:- start:362 stop:511 length:150 start_codon:yes stop_codon:yes gene_type:complete
VAGVKKMTSTVDSTLTSTVDVQFLTGVTLVEEVKKTTGVKKMTSILIQY